MPSSAAASTDNMHHIRSTNIGYDRNRQLTEVLDKVGSGSENNALTSNRNRMRGPHMCLSNDCHMHPVVLTPQLRTCPSTRKSVIDYTLRGVDVIDRRCGGERGLHICDEPISGGGK